jgi:acyl-CoA synthetase (AMP-forming)/AMP-acid ligase II
MHLSQRAQFESFTGPWARDERFLGFMPFFHAAGITFPLFCAGYGTQIEVLRMLEPAAVMEALTSGRITSTAAVPTILSLLLPALEPGHVKGLRRIFYGASGIDAGLLTRAIDRLGCDFWQIYAATETTAALTMLTPDDHRRAGPLLASCGRASPLARLRVVGDDGEEVPAGTVGEVLVKSDSVLRGYWRNEAASRAVLQGGWYRTGDLGRRDEAGYLYLVDRAKDMIITGGENVYSAEVEQVLAGVPGVAEQAVVGAPDAHWGELVTACVVPKAGAELTLDAVREALKPHLAGYKLPKRLELLRSLPRNSMGKVQKHVLRDSLARS